MSGGKSWLIDGIFLTPKFTPYKFISTLQYLAKVERVAGSAGSD